MRIFCVYYFYNYTYYIVLLSTLWCSLYQEGAILVKTLLARRCAEPAEVYVEDTLNDLTRWLRLRRAEAPPH